MPRLASIVGLHWIATATLASATQAQESAEAFFTAPENTLSVSELGTPFEMVWGDHRVGERIIKRAFLFVPVAVEGIDRELFFQFDLGAPSTVLYRAAVHSVIDVGGKLPPPIPGEATVANVELDVGTTRVSASRMEVLDHGSPIDWDRPESRPLLGTLGADWIDGHVLVLDYPRNQIQLCQTAPEAYDDSEFEPFSFRGRRVFIPAEVDGESLSLWFDTGSSAFELITSEEAFRAMALEGAKEQIYPATSWGQTIQVHNIEADSNIVVGLEEIPLRQVSYVEWPDPRMNQNLGGGDLGGMCGNLLFREHTLVLDAGSRRFWIGE